MRNLTPAEIKSLESNGCRCRNWALIEVKDPFRPENYLNVTFSGTVRLGATLDNSLDEATFLRPTGIRNAVVADCSIGDNVVISNVAALIGSKDDSGFGKCLTLTPLDETETIEVTVCEGLSAQMAAMFIRYRHDTELVYALSRLIKEHASGLSTGLMTIEDNVAITHCGEIRSVSIRSGANIQGASKLTGGIVGSGSIVGTNVIAENFIIGADSKVENGVLLDSCFIGEGCHIRNGFTAHQSLILANSTLENGEAAAIIAGPFAVSMHKSTLLIGGMFSFFNAGSGSNQSNHLYKGGPMHWGIMERGCKMSSDSYVMWPARIGAFSMIMGRHSHHPDTRDFPFSYIIENQGDTYVVPGATLRSVGTLRDILKWPSRDRRSPNRPHSDIIDPEGLSAYTCGKMLRVLKLLRRIEAECECVGGVYSFGGMYLRKSSVEKGKSIYLSAIYYWLAKTISTCDADVFNRAVAYSVAADRTDLGGQLIETDTLEHIRKEITFGTTTYADVAAAFAKAESNRAMHEYSYATAIARRLSIGSFEEICLRGAEAAEMFRRTHLEDVAREMRLANPCVSDSEIAASPLTALVNRHFSSLPFMKK